MPSFTNYYRLYPNIVVYSLFVGVFFLIFSSTLFFPYRLADDNWILRGYDARDSYPSLKFVALVQGRPLFSGLLWLSRKLSDLVGMNAVVIIRAISIAALALFASQISNILKALNWSSTVAFFVGIIVVSLPAFQVIVSGGPWLVVPLILSTWAYSILRKEFVNNTYDKKNITISLVLLIMSFCIYQSIPFIFVSLYAITLLSNRNEFISRKSVQFGVLIAVAFFCALVVYYMTWRSAFRYIQYSTFESRYNPINYNTDFAERMYLFFENRIINSLSLWYIDERYAGVYSIPAAVIIVIGILLFSVRISPKYKISSIIRNNAYIYFVMLLMYIMSDFAAFISGTPQVSFTTSVATTTLTALLIAWSILTIYSTVFAFDVRARGYISISTIAALAFFGAILAQKTTLIRFSVPLWTISEAVKSIIMMARNEGNQSRLIHVYERSKLFEPGGRSEFGWSNLNDPFYVNWMTRNALRDIGEKDDVEVVVFAMDGTKQRTFKANTELSRNDKPIIADLRSLLPSKAELAALKRFAIEQKEKSDPKVMALADALDARDSETAKRVLNQALSAEGPSFVGRLTPSGRTLLGAALCAGDLTLAREILAQGADPNTGRMRGSQDGFPNEMPFECASDIPAIELLLDSGLNEEAQNKGGFRPLHILVEKNKLKEVEMLLKRGFSPNLRQGDKRIPLHTASYYGYLEMMNLLISYGSDINARDHAGSTPEGWARSQKQDQAAQLLRQRAP